MEKQEQTLEEKRRFLEKFLNEFMIYHQDRNNLMFDNIETIYNLIYFAYNYWYDFIVESVISFDWNKISKASFFENKELIEAFYREIGIEFDFEEIIKNGTLDLSYYDINDMDNNQDGDSHFVQGSEGKHGSHKYISGWNNGLITDSIIWVHEFSHYRNESDLPETQERALLTESISFAMQFIYMDYLSKMGYTYEVQCFKLRELMNLFNSSNRCIPLLRLYIIFIKTGNISEKSYVESFIDGKYEIVINDFYNRISENQDAIFNAVWYSIALALSVYMYISYMKDKNFLDRVEQLNNGVCENMSLEELLNIIGITGYDNANVDKIRKSFDEFKNQLTEYVNQKKY